MVLVHAFGGSNPSTPAMKIVRPFGLAFFMLWSGFEPPNDFCTAKDSVGSAERCEAKLARSFRKQAEERSDIPPPQPDATQQNETHVL